MSDSISAKQQWEQSLISSFLDIVKAPDGDFAAVNKLAKASSDSESFQLLVTRLSQHPQGKKAFENRLSLGAIDLDQLRNLPENTLGHLYAEHMIQNQLKLIQAPPAESDYHFITTHFAETHDIWHVVTGSKTNIFGEIQLEAFCVAQVEVSRFWLALLTKNLLKSVLYDIETATQYMDALTKGWHMGKKAKPLFGIDWNTLWETPLEQVRASLNVEI